MKLYEGTLAGTDMLVTVKEGNSFRDLDLRLDLANHSPTGFAWGYAGSGPAQLALALLADCCGEAMAQKRYMAFKRALIAILPQDEPWAISDTVVTAIAERLKP